MLPSITVPGGDHPDDLPVDGGFGTRDLLHLFADGDLVSLGDEPGDIRFTAVIGDAAHRGALL